MFELRQWLLGIDFCGSGTFGTTHVFYPEPTEERRAMALLVEVEPIRLVRCRRRPAGEGGLLEQYVNGRRRGRIISRKEWGFGCEGMTVRIGRRE